MVTYGTITVGTTDLVFSQIGSAQVYTNGNGISMAANTVSVNLTGTSTLEFNAGALRLKSSSTAGQVLLSGGTGAEPSYGQVNLASAVTGTLPKANGGTGQDNTSVSQNLLWASPNGSTGAASYRALVAADLPTSGVTAGTYIKTTVDTYGRVTAGASLAATDIPVLDMAKISTGILGTTQGGTGLNLASIKDFPGIQRIPVRVVATSNITLATPWATIDGVSLVANDRILLSAQSTATQNGIWVWNGASSALTRPTDYPAAGTVHAFYGVWVEVLQGTTNAGTSWYISTTGAITIDTTSVTWTVASTNLSNGITGLVPLSNGGTGASSAATARTNLGAAGSATAVITGDGTTTSFNVNHGLASAKVVAKVSDPTANNEDVYPNIQYTDTNNAAIIFSVAPANGVVYNVRCSG
jgi:phage-related tail fiber protein